jgi:hypothetical protein
MRIMMAVVVSMLAIPDVAIAGEMSPGDRQRLIAHLEMTQSWLASEVRGLSPGQLTFRMAADTWSVADVVEHLAVAEPQYWDLLQRSLTEGPAGKAGGDDAGILWYGIDRTRRQRTGEARVPTGRYRTAGEALAAFETLRGTMLEFARTTTADLRGRRLVEGDMDIYQWFLMISTHSQRHILQIREIKGHPSFPSP